MSKDIQFFMIYKVKAGDKLIVKDSKTPFKKGQIVTVEYTLGVNAVVLEKYAGWDSFSLDRFEPVGEIIDNLSW